MRRFKPRLVCAALLAVGSASGYAQSSGQSPGVSLRIETDLIRIPVENDDQVPLFVDADVIRGRGREEIEAEGDAILRKRGQAVFGDFIRHNAATGDLVAQGNVVLVQRRNEVLGPYLFLNIDRQTGFMDSPVYRLTELGGRGKAERMFFEGEDRFRAERGQFTTCGPEHDDWYIRADELLIDQTRNVGTARNASLVFQGVPLFYSPMLTFPLASERKSGFLAPTFSFSGRNGPEIATPYYWAIAPNMDYTVTPRMMVKRGLQIGNEFRYLDPGYSGEARAEFLPSDRITQDSRYLFALQHTHRLGLDRFGGNWAGLINMQKVSDDLYFRDLSTRIALTSQSNLNRDAMLARSDAFGTFFIRSQRFQTLQDPLAPITPPYARLPQVYYLGNKLDVFGTDLGLASEYVSFSHPTLPNGQRMVVNPSVTLPLQTTFGFVRPKIALHHTRYMMDNRTTTLQDATRTLPIFSIDSGVVLERDTSMFGRGFTQTLEPRLFYSHIPFRDQSRLPVFDSALPDPNFVTLFQENLYSGSDRIADANQVTAGMVSRLIDPDTGAERLRVGIAQRFYLDSLQVTLPGAPERGRSKSDLIGSFTGQLWSGWTIDAGLQYSTTLSSVERTVMGVRYVPEPGMVFNASYRYSRTQLEQIDLSTQWRLGRGWSTLARYNYSFRDRTILEGLAGFQYDDDCWSFRFVANRIAVATQQANTAFFFQIELGGLSKVGSNPIELLRRSIPGYTETELNRAQPVTTIPYPMR
ncbi:MAG: LPS-assembly protein LptD [bacterium]|jgi:LPS-assembly protein|nr:LPS-assembly protein LptD [Betaproteobacteria bacterium]